MATPINTPDKVTYFAETDYRSKRIKFGIRDQDRERHMYVIGKTGMGKSTMLETLAIQDIANGEGLCFIDPHGGTAETLLSYIPEHRVNDVIYFAPFDQEFPVALNVMEDIGRDKRPLVASGLIGAFKKVWVDAWSARMEYILSNALLALLEFPGATLLGVNRIFADKNYRSLIVNNVTDPSVKAFWLDEYAKYSDKFATEATAAIQNKVGQFAANPLIRNMIGQSKSTFDIRKVMDERKILIVNLSKGRMGEGNANLVGSMLITKIYLAAMSRADVGAEVVRGLPPFYLYVDEFQSFANESFADILSEARKYKLSLTIAHQYIEQMSEEVRAAVFGNVGTMCSFRVGAFDAEVLEKEYAPAFIAEDMVNLGFAQIYLKLMINGVGSAPFSATTLNRPPFPSLAYTDQVIAASRAQFGRPRALVEDEIKKWHEPIPEPPRDPNALPVPETRKYAPGMRPMRPGESAMRGGPLADPRFARPQYGASAPYAPVAPIRPAVPMRPTGAFVQTQAPLPQQEILQESVLSVAPERARPVAVLPSAPRSAPPVERDMPPVRAREQLHDSAPSTPPEQGRGSVPSVPMHQPFRDELQKMRVPEGETVRVQVQAPRRTEDASRPPKRELETEHRSPASLSTLKSQAKKDKGPSTENLSSLKTLIEAAFATKDDNRKVEHIPPPIPERRKESFNKAPIASSPAATPSLLDNARPVQAPKEVPEDVLRGVLAD
ncbi:MAG: hypothetical protein A3C93_03420 [Candidatus Lloydbacteria bacterium RIFCSPHIGHO2_02_FULL_54_17]|uniref:Uncharacterized protein n=1 Tax=Candidatus Lloydbacteria bacterium RIFCSPHIGHO2_02_FULL_54_17 TaxID=1798664 RepID=A0A1G2DFI9_9BACT|nr:MAG: hypothetical protein A3C93_03420 [Candidatus Lloydbacteria bacterium RIFCSPHIGHO2_02_FULL_54_17]OGZ14493.1 MAG: hypothetical protein A3H76_06040 [Candidatus Lloydbacteria bacterium RIFCSPLOWO2_02_FULL_54_12]OGZ14571.1 MAG: hypothetical protein A2948_05700 [Candidatus Lloydbacteria bacterium RIFCSPLOWO2_01_FULL_54_18]